jgi:3'-phosphoadenosine 5'-phosphosulfate sulfotransferase (PAPS reductase)/FAD synthetase
LLQLQVLPLVDKIALSERRIREWYERWDGQVYVAFSGGKDSTVLLHLVRSLYPEVPAVFFDTGMEFPEIRSFALSRPNVVKIRPTLSFREVLARYGYPVVSKRISQYVHEYRTGYRKHGQDETPTMKLRRCGLKADGSYSKLGKVSGCWQKLLWAPFEVSGECCAVFKHRPAHQFERLTTRKGFIGTLAAESQARQLQWYKDGCNSYDVPRPTSKPLSVWLETDIWEYLRGGNRAGELVDHSSIYSLGYTRTGCIFCGFGLHLEMRDTGTNRFLRLEQTHPQLHAYCMKPADAGGLGLAEVLDYIGVPHSRSCLGDEPDFELAIRMLGDLGPSLEDR